MENSEVFTVLYEIANRSISTKNRYEEMIRFIHRHLNKKDIYFSEELKEKYDLRYREIKFDEGYFENGHYNPLFVGITALADNEVYSWLREAYNLTHEDNFSEEVLKREIERFEGEKGPLYIVDFVEINDSEDFGLIYAQKRFYTNDGSSYTIHGSLYEVMADGKIKIEFIIEFMRFHSFYAIIDDNAQFREAIKFNWPKKDDLLYMIAEEQLKDKVSENWDSE